MASPSAGLHRSQVERAGESLELDWCFDSALRFFPVIPDPQFGYVLHDADIATNKILAMAGRIEIRDYVDVLFLHQSYLSLGALCWAASGKDRGLTPWMIVDLASRHVRYQDEDLQALVLRQPMSLIELRKQWIQAVDDALRLFDSLPVAEMGCLYLDSLGQPVTPDPTTSQFGSLARHFGAIRGAWPTVWKAR